MTIGGSIICDLSCAAGFVPVDTGASDAPIAGSELVQMNCPVSALKMVVPNKSSLQ